MQILKFLGIQPIYGLFGPWDRNDSSWSPGLRREYQLKQLANRRSYHKNSNPNDAAVGEIDLNAVFYPKENAVVIQPHDVINNGLLAFGKPYAENLERTRFEKMSVQTYNFKDSKLHFWTGWRLEMGDAGSRNSTGELIKDALSAVGTIFNRPNFFHRITRRYSMFSTFRKGSAASVRELRYR